MSGEMQYLKCGLYLVCLRGESEIKVKCNKMKEVLFYFNTAHKLCNNSDLCRAIKSILKGFKFNDNASATQKS